MKLSEQILKHLIDVVRRHAGKPECVAVVSDLINGYAKAVEAEKHE